MYQKKRFQSLGAPVALAVSVCCLCAACQIFSVPEKAAAFGELRSAASPLEQRTPSSEERRTFEEEMDPNTPLWTVQPPKETYLFSAKDNESGNYGYMDHTGEWVVPPVFQKTLSLMPYLFVVDMDLLPAQKEDLWGFVDRDGVWKIPPVFDSVEYFEQGRAFVEYQGEAALLDLDGNLGAVEALGNAPFASNGMAVCQQLWQGSTIPLCGYLNRQGEWVIPPEYTFPPEFSPVARAYQLSFCEGVAVVCEKETYRFGAIDESGAWVIPPSFEGLYPFTEGVAAACQEGKWGFIDHEGNWVIQPIYQGAQVFSEGLAPVKLGTAWGCVDHAGELVIPAQFDLLDEDAFYFNGFHDGLLCVTEPETSLSGYLNQKGEWSIPPIYEHATPFLHGVARVFRNHTVQYIRPDGSVLQEWQDRG